MVVFLYGVAAYGARDCVVSVLVKWVLASASVVFVLAFGVAGAWGDRRVRAVT